MKKRNNEVLIKVHFHCHLDYNHRLRISFSLMLTMMSTVHVRFHWLSSFFDIFDLSTLGCSFVSIDSSFCGERWVYWVFLFRAEFDDPSLYSSSTKITVRSVWTQVWLKFGAQPSQWLEIDVSTLSNSQELKSETHICGCTSVWAFREKSF